MTTKPVNGEIINCHKRCVTGHLATVTLFQSTLIVFCRTWFVYHCKRGIMYCSFEDKVRNMCGGRSKRIISVATGRYK